MRRRPARVVAVLALAALGVGCYSTGRVRFAEHPELAGIRLAAKGATGSYEQVAFVHTKVRGFRGCSGLVLDALRELAAEAEALGATEVRDVEFRGRWRWMGRMVCRGSPIGRSTEVRGWAAHPPPPGTLVTPSELPAPEPAAPEEPLEVATIELPPEPPPFGSGSEAECLAWRAYMDDELDQRADAIRSDLVAERAERPDSPVVDDAWRSLEAQIDAKRRFIETNAEACQAAARGD